MMRRKLLSVLLGLVATAAAVSLASAAVNVSFAPASLALSGTSSKTVALRVSGLSSGTALAFASFQFAWDKTAFAVQQVSWQSSVLEITGVATPFADGLNLSAARVAATGSLAGTDPLLTLKLTAKPGKTGSYSLSFKQTRLTQLRSRYGGVIRVTTWGTLPVTIGSASPAASVDSLVISQSRGGLVAFSYTLREDASVGIAISNLAGRSIRCLLGDARQSAGQGTQLWDLRADTGAKVPAGVYLATITARQPNGTEQRVIQTFHVLGQSR
jgi:hypothetical protein